MEFNGVPAAYQTPTSTSELIVTVPSGASSGPVTVFNNKGSGASFSLLLPSALDHRLELQCRHCQRDAHRYGPQFHQYQRHDNQWSRL